MGPSGSGPTDMLSSDYYRCLVSDDENDRVATNDAVGLLHYIASTRLAAGRSTVIDATSVQRWATLIELAREFHTLPVAIVFNLPEEVCWERNRGRRDRNVGAHVNRQHQSRLRRSLKGFGMRDSGTSSFLSRMTRSKQSRRSGLRSGTTNGAAMVRLTSSGTWSAVVMNWNSCSGVSRMSDGRRTLSTRDGWT